MKQADLIWMNGEFVAWEDAKVHVLTHALHYGTGVFEGVRAYETERGTAVFRHQDHIDRLFKSAQMYYMDVPFTKEQIREATLELIARNGLKSCYIRPVVYRGAGPMGLYPLDCPVDVFIAVWEWGAYLGEEGKQRGVRAKVVLVAQDRPGRADPARQGQRPVPQLRARQDRGREGRLRGGHPARPARLRLRGHGREPVRDQGRRDRHARLQLLDPRRHQPAVGDHDRPRPRLRGRRARRRPRRAVHSPTRSS